jgi:hypothetical protein
MEKLTAEQKKKLAAQIKALDMKGEIVTLSPNPDFTGGTIAYRPDSGLTLGEKVARLTDEEYVRAWLVVRLIRKFKYPADALDIEHTYTIGRPSPTKAQIDIRVHDNRGKKTQTFMIIEAKRPDDYESYTKLLDDQLFATGRDESSRACVTQSGIRSSSVEMSLMTSASSLTSNCLRSIALGSKRANLATTSICHANTAWSAKPSLSRAEKMICARI